LNVKPTKDSSKLPHYAHTTIGVGGLVIGNDGRVLTITEKYMPLRDFWKMPGGAVDAREQLTTAAVREVFEETGITTQFVSILGVRHQHQARHGCSDMYFICMMRPTRDGQRAVPQPGEVDQCKWMELNTFMTLPSVRFLVPLQPAICHELVRMYGPSILTLPTVSSLLHPIVTDGHTKGQLVEDDKKMDIVAKELTIGTGWSYQPVPLDSLFPSRLVDDSSVFIPSATATSTSDNHIHGDGGGMIPTLFPGALRRSAPAWYYVVPNTSFPTPPPHAAALPPNLTSRL
jgi:ADP-ribose pyrophosphatase YjhB (NUDIX family)